jgi:hypothetical protein
MSTDRKQTTRRHERNAAIRRTDRLRAVLVGAAIVVTVTVGGGLGLHSVSAATPATTLAPATPATPTRPTTPTSITKGISQPPSTRRQATKPHRAAGLVSRSQGGQPQATTKGS